MDDDPYSLDGLPEGPDELRQAVFRIAEQINGLTQREHETCPFCGAHVEALREAGRDVYAVPCGCRVYQGVVPLVWREER